MRTTLIDARPDGKTRNLPGINRSVRRVENGHGAVTPGRGATAGEITPERVISGLREVRLRDDWYIKGGKSRRRCKRNVMI
jgi:hypothetical protein